MSLPRDDHDHLGPGYGSLNRGTKPAFGLGPGPVLESAGKIGGSLTGDSG